MNKPSGNAETVYQTEAQWTADTRVFGADVIAITTDGANAGKHKMFKGTGRWTTLNYVENGGGGAVTSDDVTVTGDMAPGPLTVSLDTLLLNVSDQGTAITTLAQALGTIPKVYAFIANQTGTNAPVMTVLNNTLSAAVVWAYVVPGQYTGTLAGAFPAGKTIVITPLSVVQGDIENGSTRYLYRIDDNTIGLSTNDGGTGTDGMLVNSGFKLEVYP